MERRRELAAMAPGTLLTVAVHTTWLLRTADSAHRTLGTVAETLRALRETAKPGGGADGLFGGAFASALLDGALSDLAGIHAIHHRAAVTYRRYAVAGGRLIPADGDGRRAPDPALVATWGRHSRDAFSHARDAKRKLRSAASIARAVEDAVQLFRSSPTGSPEWTTWTSAALRLALHAAVSAALALRALRRMRDAVALEFHGAWRVLYG